MDRLSHGTLSVSALAAPLDITLTAVAQHLQILEESALVHTEKLGRVRTCRIETKGFSALEQWIRDHRSLWQRGLINSAICSPNPKKTNRPSRPYAICPAASGVGPPPTPNQTQMLRVPHLRASCEGWDCSLLDRANPETPPKFHATARYFDFAKSSTRPARQR